MSVRLPLWYLQTLLLPQALVTLADFGYSIGPFGLLALKTCMHYLAFRFNIEYDRTYDNGYSRKPLCTLN